MLQDGRELTKRSIIRWAMRESTKRQTTRGKIQRVGRPGFSEAGAKRLSDLAWKLDETRKCRRVDVDAGDEMKTKRARLRELNFQRLGHDAGVRRTRRWHDKSAGRVRRKFI